MKTKTTNEEPYIEIEIDYSYSMLLPLTEGLKVIELFANAVWLDRNFSNKGHKIVNKEVEFKIRPPGFLEEVKLNSVVDP